MLELTAIPVIKNKFWIVESQGQKIATIQTTDDGIVWVDATNRTKFSTIKILKNKFNIEFAKPDVRSSKAKKMVEQYPTDVLPFNQLYDCVHRLHVYTKEPKSKSFYCAGYYLVKCNNNWSKMFCPKLITLQRYLFQGPFGTVQEQQLQLDAQHAS